MRPGLRLTPWAAAALGESDRRALEAQAKSLGAYVTAGGQAGRWTVHAMSEHSAIRESVYHVRGPLAMVMGDVLADFAKQRDIVDEQLADLGIDNAWTAEELVQIAAQSGMDVQRA